MRVWTERTEESKYDQFYKATSNIQNWNLKYRKFERSKEKTNEITAKRYKWYTNECFLLANGHEQGHSKNR